MEGEIEPEVCGCSSSVLKESNELKTDTFIRSLFLNVICGVCRLVSSSSSSWIGNCTGELHFRHLLQIYFPLRDGDIK